MCWHPVGSKPSTLETPSDSHDLSRCVRDTRLRTASYKSGAGASFPDHAAAAESLAEAVLYAFLWKPVSEAAWKEGLSAVLLVSGTVLMSRIFLKYHSWYIAQIGADLFSVWSAIKVLWFLFGVGLYVQARMRPLNSCGDVFMRRKSLSAKESRCTQADAQVEPPRGVIAESRSSPTYRRKETSVCSFGSADFLSWFPASWVLQVVDFRSTWR